MAVFDRRALAEAQSVKPAPGNGGPGGNKNGLLKLVGLAAVLAAGTWLLSSILLPGKLPEDFPALPDLKTANPDIRNSLAGADREARKHPGSAEAIGTLGIAYHANEYFEQAARAYRIAAGLAPRDSRWAYAQAVLYAENGNEEQQFDFLRQTIRLKPDHVPALLKLADRAFKHDRLDEARRYYELAAKASDKDAGMQIAFGLARVAVRREEWNKVVEYTVPLCRDYPYVRPPYQLLETAYEALGQADKAAQVRETIPSSKFTDVPPIKDPFNDQLIAASYSSTRLLKEAGVLSHFGSPDRGIQVARRAAEVVAADPDPHNFIARTLLTFYPDKPEAIAEALTELGECLRLKPDDPAPLFGFANSFFDAPKIPEAVEQLRTLLRQYANRDEAHFYLGLVAEAQGKTEEAVSQYQAALKHDPNNRRIYNKLGLIFARAGKLDGAIGYFQKYIQLNPLNSDVRLNLAIALIERGNYDQGMKELTEVLRLNPHDATAHFCMGFGLLHLKRIDEAISAFRNGLRNKPDDAGAHYGIASAFAMQRKREQAVAELQEALRLRPNYPEAQNMLRQLEH
jgi:tetratricopeptide (TPR) repeat protein